MKSPEHHQYRKFNVARNRLDKNRKLTQSNGLSHAENQQTWPCRIDLMLYSEFEISNVQVCQWHIWSWADRWRSDQFQASASIRTRYFCPWLVLETRCLLETRLLLKHC